MNVPGCETLPERVRHIIADPASYVGVEGYYIGDAMEAMAALQRAERTASGRARGIIRRRIEEIDRLFEVRLPVAVAGMAARMETSMR